MRRLTFLAAAVLVAACASTDRDVSHHERVCAPGIRYVDLKRNRFGNGEVRPLPQLERDFFRNAVASARNVRSREVLTSAVNRYVNERIDDLNANRFNTIYVSIDSEHAIGVTPAIHGERRDVVMVWIDDTAMIVDGTGKLLGTPAQFGLGDLPPARETFAASASLPAEREVCSSAYASR